MTIGTTAKATSREILSDSAGAIAGRIARRELSATEVMEAHLARVHQVNGVLNAVVAMDAESAMRQAAEIEYYYTPHFISKIDDETTEDSMFLNKYRIKHEALTHISDEAYNEVIAGMNDVVTMGTARVAQIPGIDVCAKTGTAQNSTFLDGKKLDLPDNSMFVCFAPKDNPKIAIAVAVENAGFGATWGGPIARILMEKYLNDTLQTKSVADVERISNANLMPIYLKRKQFIQDSTSAQYWFKMRKDSSYIRKYITSVDIDSKPVNNKKNNKPQQVNQELVAILAADNKSQFKISNKPVIIG